MEDDKNIIAGQEKKKYSDIWKQDYHSGKSKPFANILNKECKGNILDIGCGNGETKTHLNPSLRYNALDITTNQIKDKSIPVYEMPVWDIKTIGVDFDYTVSNDVLEHLPTEMVEQAIKGIVESSIKGTIHAISTRDAIADYCGHKVHLTVRPLDWWEDMFKKYIKEKGDGFKLILLDSDKI